MSQRSSSKGAVELWYPGDRTDAVKANLQTTQLIRPRKVRDPYAHFAGVGRYLVMMQTNQDGYATDVELNLAGRKTLVHSSVVAAHSRWLRKKIKEEHLPLSIDLPQGGVSVDGLKRALSYCYSGTVWVGAENIRETLQASVLLEVVHLTVLLESYLIQISASPAYSLFCVKLAYDIDVRKETRNSLVEEAAKNFNISLSWPDAPAYFKHLPYTAVIHLMSHPLVVRGSQLLPFHAARQWLSFTYGEGSQADVTQVRMDVVCVLNCVQWATMKHKHIEYCVLELQKDKLLKDYIVVMAGILKERLATETAGMNITEKQKLEGEEKSFREGN